MPSAGITGQVGKSTLSAHRFLVPADLRTGFSQKRSSNCCAGGPPHSVLFSGKHDGSELSDWLREQGYAVGSDRWQRRREPGRCRGRPLVASGYYAFLHPKSLTSWRLLPCSGSSDRCSCRRRTFRPWASRSSSHRDER